VNAYRVMSNGHSDSSAGERAPKSIKFYGSNDGIEWMELDDRSHETGWVMNEMRQYEFTNETAYTRYRIEFYACNTGDKLEFFKLEYGNTGRCGRLHVAVSSGTKTNSGVTLTGNLRLIKEGAGTLIASKTGQTYGGGTEVAGGILKPGAAGRVHPFGAEGRDIIVHDGAVLDAAGQVGFGKYEITLRGLWHIHPGHNTFPRR
jgi:autotransporter-associated beta strand protein